MVIVAKGPTVLNPTLKRLGGPTTATSRTLHINNVEITIANKKVRLKPNKPLHTRHEVDVEFHLVVWEDGQPGVACGGVLGDRRFLPTADT